MVEKEIDQLVSLVIPVYNTEKYIYTCLESAVNQTYSNLEIIVVNDGTPDRAMSIVNQFAQKDQRIKIIEQENKGLSEARNQGMDHMKGEFLFFLDSDDAIHPQTIEILLRLSLKNQADIVTCNFLKCKAIPTDFPDIQISAEMLCREQAIENIFCRSYEGVSSRMACAKLYRRAVIEGLRFPKGKLHEDEFLIHRLLYRCCRICYCHNILYYYYQNQTSIMHNITTQRAFDLLEACRDKIYFFGQQGEQKFCKWAIDQYLEESINHYYALKKAGLLTAAEKVQIQEGVREILPKRDRGSIRYNLFSFSPFIYFWSIRVFEYIVRKAKHGK